MFKPLVQDCEMIVELEGGREIKRGNDIYKQRERGAYGQEITENKMRDRQTERK